MGFTKHGSFSSTGGKLPAAAEQLQTQLLAALARAERAETERTQALNSATAAQQAVALARQAATADPLTTRPLVDTKALGQPPKLKRRDLLPNWPEWKHKVLVFVSAHFKQHVKRVVEAVIWAELQRKQIDYDNELMDSRVVGSSYEFSQEQQQPDLSSRMQGMCFQLS